MINNSTIIDYLDELTLQYAQWCQRTKDGSYYAIADGLQCRQGKPVPEPKRSIPISAKPISNDPKSKALANSPKYDKTPGSSTKLPRKSEDEYREIAKEIVAKNPNLEKGVREFVSGKTDEVPLSVLYGVQGFNAKPELVARTRDLLDRQDVLKKDNGETLLFFRGSSLARTEQLLGIGEDGNVHGAGKGMFGNGTYASATNKGWDGDDSKARGTAREYATSIKDGNNMGEKVATFALRSDAKILDFDTDFEFDDWFENVISRAERATGLTFSEPGEAAAALGIHAYKVPGGSTGSIKEDYWVILNRGAIIASVEEFE
jgi:hypothetical protein